MEPERRRRSDRHQAAPAPARQAGPDQESAQQASPEGQQAPAIGQALSDLGKSGSQLMSALLHKGGDAVGKLSEKVKDGSLAEEFKRNDALKQGLIFFAPVLLLFIATWFRSFWLLLGMAAACFYLWRYQMGALRRTRWDYLLLVLPLVIQLFTNLPMIVEMVKQNVPGLSGRYYGGVYASDVIRNLVIMMLYITCILLFAWMRSRTRGLLKAVRVTAWIGIGMVVTVLVLMKAFDQFLYGMFNLLQILAFIAFYAVLLYFCHSRAKEKDYTAYHLGRNEAWRPVIALQTMFFGVFGVHRRRLGYYASGNVILWGTLSLFVSSLLLLLFTATRSFGMIRFGVILMGAASIYMAVSAVWVLVDLVRVLLGNLKPRDGAYAPSELVKPAVQQEA